MKSRHLLLTLLLLFGLSGVIHAENSLTLEDLGLPPLPDSSPSAVLKFEDAQKKALNGDAKAQFQLGWMYSKEESNGNFWLYESEIGWLWTGPSYFDVSSDNKAFFYSVSDAGWLYFKLDGGLKKFYRYSDQKWILPDRTETTKP